MPTVSSKQKTKQIKGAKPNLPGINYFWGSLFLLLIVALIYARSTKFSGAQETTWKEFKTEMLLSRDVDKILISNKETALIYLKADSLKKAKFKSAAKNFTGKINQGPHYYLPLGSVEVFERHLDEAQSQFDDDSKIQVSYVNESGGWLDMFINWFAPILVVLFFWFFIMNRLSNASGMGRSIYDFGKSSPEIYEKGINNPVTFKDVAGYDEAKTEVMEIVEFLKKPENFTKLGAKIPKGVLLVGAPGTGKTLIAKAVAGEAGVPFFSLSGSEFIEMFVGVGASRVRDLFNKAKQKAPSIIFIDEIETIGRMRGKVLSFQSNDERESTLNQLLAEMDGFGPNTGVIVLAATNRADIMDPALLRPGRFDRHIHLDLPNKQERFEIFQVHLKPLLLDKAVDAENLAAQTPGFSGADIANVCNEAALIAARKKKTAVEVSDFVDSIDRIVAGLEKKSKLISPAEKRIIAYHEAGHAVVSWMLKNSDPLLKVSIIPRGKSLGGSWYMPEERQIITLAQFKDRLCAGIGGRTAEELVFNEPSSGALDDLEKVTKLAYTMVTQLGLCEKTGFLSYYDSTGIYENSFQKPFSEATAQLIDEEVRKLIKEAHINAKTILEINRSKLDALAELLIKKEVVYKEEIESVLGKSERIKQSILSDAE
jgi:cell division protease FtsH